jgi:hypothetical protein
MYSSSSFADSSSTPPSDSSSTFKVNSPTKQIMLKSKLTAAFEDELGAQQKLTKQQAAAEKVQNSQGSSHSSKEKDRNSSSSSRSSREKVSSRSSKSSRRHSDSGSKRSDHHRSDRHEKKDTKEREHPRPSKSKDEHHYNSDRDKKREKQRQTDISEQAKSRGKIKVVVDEELYVPCQPLSSDNDVPVPGSFILWPIIFSFGRVFYLFLFNSSPQRQACCTAEGEGSASQFSRRCTEARFVYPFTFQISLPGFIYLFLFNSSHNKNG